MLLVLVVNEYFFFLPKYILYKTENAIERKTLYYYRVSRIIQWPNDVDEIIEKVKRTLSERVKLCKLSLFSRHPRSTRIEIFIYFF